MTFGRKGLPAGQTAPQAARGFGRAAQPVQPNAASEPSEADDLAAKRAAFIASERARKHEEIGGGSLPDANGEYSDDPMAHLRNEARPAKPLPYNDRPHQNTMSSPNQPLKMQGAARSRSGSSSGFIFGDPGGRSVGLAYVLWFVLGQLSVHRFYCGQADSAWFQLGLFIGSLICLFAVPALGVVGFIGWCIWIVADLFLIPGMMRRFKAENAFSNVFS
ncbi:MAG: TM2 domain-containing protein [Pseudomonadota bacterium]